MLCLKVAGGVANSVDHDETSHLGLHCLLRPVCSNTYNNYCKLDFFDFFQIDFLQ